MSASEKTERLLRLSLPVTALVKNEANPNKMAAREFDLLIDNIERTGLTDPILVRPVEYDKVFEIAAKFDMPHLELVLTKEELKFRIVGGHHRFDAAAYLGLEEVPVTVIMDDAFDEDQERFQLVRMNMIRGKLDPQAFFDLYNSLAPAYSDEVLQDAFGFADEAEFRKLIDQTAKALPDKNLQKKFKEAAEEIKTIDGLSKLLNEMFTKYGDTLPFGYMVFDHGGQRSMWLRIEGKTMNALDLLGTFCIDKARTVDDIIGGILQLAAKGEIKEHVDKVIAKTPAVELPNGLSVAPTKDNLQKIAAL
jgi:ParB-like nuclease domain